MQLYNSMEVDFETSKNIPQHIQFEFVEDELLAIERPTVQVYGKHRVLCTTASLLRID